MNILLVVTGLPSQKAPFRSAFNLKYAKELQRKGVNTEIMYLRSVHFKRNFLKRNEIEGVSYIEGSFIIPEVGPLRSTFFLNNVFKHYLPRLKQLLYKVPDVIHVIGGGGVSAGFHLSSFFEKPLLIQFIGSDINIKLSALMKTNDFTEGLKIARRVIFNSEGLRNEFFKKVTIEKYTDVAYRGVQIEDFTFSARDSVSEVKTLFLGGFPGNNGNLKGGQTLIAMIRRLEDKKLYKKLQFQISGPNSDKPLMAEINNEKIEVKFTGPSSSNEVREAMKTADILVIPSLAEGIPNVLYEGMASGCTILASKVGGIPEIIESEVNGILVPPNDVDALCSAFLALIENSEKMNQLAEKARRDIEKLDYGKFIARYICHYKEIMNLDNISQNP